MPRDASKTAMRALAVGALVLFVGGGARFVISLALKPIEADLSGGRALVGSAVFAFQIISAMAMMYGGRLADRHDIRAVLGAGIAIAAAGLLGTALVTSPLQLWIVYGVVFALGNGIASLIPVGIMIARVFPTRIGMANSIVQTGMGLGQLVILAALSGAVIDIGWRRIYLWLAAVQISLLAFVYFGIAREAAQPRQSARQDAVAGLSLAEGVRTGRFWMLATVYALCGLEDFFVTTHIVAFAQDYGANAFFAGNLLAAMGLTTLIGVLAAGWASDRFGPVVPMLAAFVLRVALFAAVLIDKSTVTVSLFALLFGATFLVTAPLCVVFCREAFGMRNLGLFTGLITMIHHIAGGLGAWAGAVWFDSVGNYQVILAVMLASSLVAAGLAMGMRSNRTEIERGV